MRVEQKRCPTGGSAGGLKAWIGLEAETFAELEAALALREKRKGQGI